MTASRKKRQAALRRLAALGAKVPIMDSARRRESILAAARDRRRRPAPRWLWAVLGAVCMAAVFLLIRGIPWSDF